MTGALWLKVTSWRPSAVRAMSPTVPFWGSRNIPVGSPVATGGAWHRPRLGRPGVGEAQGAGVVGGVAAGGRPGPRHGARQLGTYPVVDGQIALGTAGYGNQ